MHCPSGNVSGTSCLSARYSNHTSARFVSPKADPRHLHPATNLSHACLNLILHQNVLQANLTLVNIALHYMLEKQGKGGILYFTFHA